MDLLSQRYASPNFFMDGMILSGRFSSFVTDFIKQINKEKEDQVEWDIFLHKVWDKSYADFKEEIKINKQHKEMSERTIETTVQNSMEILNNFNPEEGGET